MPSEDPPNESRDSWDRLWEAFHQARNYTVPAEQSLYLDSLESVDRDLSLHVKQLIAADLEGGEFLQELIGHELSFLQPAAEQDDNELLPDELLAGRFRIIRQIGKGGMGTVYEALDEEIGVSVALKTMRQDRSLESSARERFHREIHLARQITHPNACRIFDLFRDGDLLFLTMELLHGETLQEHIRKRGSLTVSDATPIVLQILEALAVIHDAGIVHRDLKSSNILLVEQQNGVRAIVTDFGLATSLAPDNLQLTQTGLVLGTPEFMSPEQLANRPITAATDVYALGLVIYEMLTGAVPLAGESPLTIAARRINEDAPSPRRVVPDLSRYWERIILRCLERNPKHRFQNAHDVLHAFQHQSMIAPLALVSTRHRTRVAYGILFVALAVITALLASRLGLTGKYSGNRELEVKRLWAGATGLPPGVLSTDGEILIDVDWQTANLMAIDLSSGRKRRITKSARWFLPQDFSPHPIITCLSQDSKKIAYSVKLEWHAGCELRVVNLDGSNPTTLYSNTKSCISPADWSPDLRQILSVVDHRDGTGEIILVSQEDRSVRPLKRMSGNIRKMGFSADGRYIVYDLSQQDNPANHDIFLMSLKDGAERKLVQHEANDYFLGWSPDGKHILFASDRSGSHDAWSVPVVEGKAQGVPRRIRKDIGQIFPLKLTKDGSLFYSQLLTSHDIYNVILNPDGTSAAVPPEKMVHGLAGSNDGPEFSPDGKTLIFQSSYNPLMTRWTVNQPNSVKLLSLETNEVSDFPFQAAGVSGRVRWSPDGQSILFCAPSHKLGAGIYRLEMSSGEWTQVLPLGTANFVRQFQWSADGSGVLYMYNKGGIIWRKDLSTGRIQKIHSGANDFVLSPDGQSMVLMISDTRLGYTSLKLIPSIGGNPREILKLKLPEWISAIAWAPDSKHVFYGIGRRDLIDDPHKLWKLSVDGRKKYDVGVATESLLDLRVHPDGKRLAIWTAFDTSDVWVMKNFLQN